MKLIMYYLSLISYYRTLLAQFHAKQQMLTVKCERQFCNAFRNLVSATAGESLSIISQIIRILSSDQHAYWRIKIFRVDWDQIIRTKACSTCL